jgi:hypothetical protein
MVWGVPVSTLENMSADDLNGYQAYLSLEPTGSTADDVRTAIVAHTVACCMSSKPPQFKDFLPQWEPPKAVSYAEGAKAFEAYLRS